MNDSLNILFDEQAIERKVVELAAQISRDYAGKELIAVCILKGAALFTTDLVRHIAAEVTVDFVQAASYGASTAQPAEVSLAKDVSADISGKHVLLVDGIVDSGKTLAFLLERYGKRDPASLRVAVLLDKSARRTVPVQIDYKGFTIPDHFVVGYGMDAAEKYRNLPYIATLKTS